MDFKQYKDEVFKEAYQKYYTNFTERIHKRLVDSDKVYPSQEIQNAVIEEAKGVECAFRFIDELNNDVIKPLYPGDDLYIFGTEIKNDDFFSLIHKDYFIPYIISAAFAYEMSLEIKPSWDDFNKLSYQINIPLKLPGRNYYFWYIQRSKALTVNENYGVISHINFYIPYREFKTFGKREESMFIAPVVLYDNKVYEKFQASMKHRMTQFFKEHHVFQRQHWKVINARCLGNEMPKEYTSNTVNSLNKEIIHLMKVHTGYKFLNINEVILYLREINVIT